MRWFICFWPLRGRELRILGYPDAAFKNNPDKSTQRGQAVFIAEGRKEGEHDDRAALVGYDSTKIKNAVMSTPVAELRSFVRCFGTCQFLEVLWVDLTGEALPIHTRTDAKNLVTTASTTHLPEQRETIHMITRLRSEACSGSIDDVAHVSMEDCLSDCLTKGSATRRTS